QRIAFCEQQGMDRRRLLVDPGIGFGKTTQHNLTLLQRSRVWRGLGLPWLLGVSRKQIVGALTGESDPHRRDVGSHVLGILVDADILRVHDVAGARQALAVATGFTQAPLEAAA
ncbi:MAG: dihydropteroate synthase, partial [Magnetococcus sp. YQC-5]